MSLETIKNTVKEYASSFSLSVTGTLSGEVSYLRNRTLMKLKVNLLEDSNLKTTAKFIGRTAARSVAEIAYALLTLAGIVETLARGVIALVCSPLALIHPKRDSFLRTLKVITLGGFCDTLISTIASGKNVFYNIFNLKIADVPQNCQINHNTLNLLILNNSSDS